MMYVPAFIICPEDFEAEWHNFLSLKRSLKVPERIYKTYQNKLLKKELCSDIFSREAEAIQEMNYDFFQEHLSWMVKYVYYGPAPIRLMVEPRRDIRDDYLHWTLTDYALLTGDIKSMALFVKYGIGDQTFRRNPKRKSMDLYERQIDRLTLDPTDPSPVAKKLNLYLEKSKEFIRAKLEIFSFAIHASRYDLLPPIDPEEFCLLIDWSLMDLFEGHGEMVRSARGFRRILLIAKLLRAWTHSGLHFEDRKVCLELYFRTIKDPFICKEEFREFLWYFYDDISEDSIKSLAGDYESLFQDFAPRSLKHLCRCTLRSVLAKKARYLPDAVNGLRCPNPLKRYIYGQL